MRFFQAGSFLLGLLLVHPGNHQFIDFLCEYVVESHVHVPDKVVALLAGRFRSRSVSDRLPCKHGFADVDSPVVDQGGLDHIVSTGLEKP